MSNKSTISVKEDCENSERGTKRLSSRRKISSHNTFYLLVAGVCSSSTKSVEAFSSSKIDLFILPNKKL